MNWQTPAILSLIWLAAAAAPPGDCRPDSSPNLALPVLIDLAERPPAPPAGLAGQTFATLPGAQVAADCHNALPSTAQATILRNDSADVLHGLPGPDIARRLDGPRGAPEFQ
jgi:hypothetical protein